MAPLQRAPPRRGPSTGSPTASRPGDIPVVGDWNGDGVDGVGIFRKGEWHLSNALSPASTFQVVRFGVEPGDIPVVGDWANTGRDCIGIYRPASGTWYLRDSLD